MARGGSTGHSAKSNPSSPTSGSDSAERLQLRTDLAHLLRTLDGISVQAIGTREDGQARCAANAADVLEHVPLRQRTHIRFTGLDTAGHETADEEGLCPAGLGQPGRDGVEGTHAYKGTALSKQRAESLIAGHREISSSERVRMRNSRS
jgi:hypothetical protein